MTETTPSSETIQVDFTVGPPFNFHFFRTMFPDRVRSMCPGQGEQIPGVVLKSVDDCTLDLCHIMLLAPKWMAVAAFRETGTCEEMDTVFVPYESILRVTVSARDGARRHMGFRFDQTAPALVETAPHKVPISDLLGSKRENDPSKV